MIVFIEALVPLIIVVGIGFGVWRGARATARALHARQEHVELEEARWEVKTVTGMYTRGFAGMPSGPAILVQIEKRGHNPVEVSRVPTTVEDVEQRLMEAQSRAESLAKTMNGE